jgi:hypothetical protein
MSLDILREKGIPLDKQEFDWRDMVRTPISKLDDDAFTRVRVLLLSAVESEALRFGHACARMNKGLGLPLARIRRVEQHQQTLVSWLLPADQSPLETTLAYAQAAVEVTASVAEQEPDSYLKQVHVFGMIEHLDHLYRFSALLDRMGGMDANNILQCYTDIRPGRPSSVAHRAPEDSLRDCYDRKKAHPISKLGALTVLAFEHHARDYCMAVGPLFADPAARQLYAEVASIEEQHVTEHASIIDPYETWLEKWLLHEICEVYNYYAAYEQEPNARIKSIWERFVQYELGHLQVVKQLFETVEKRDAQEIVPKTLPAPVRYESHRRYVREALARDVDLRASGGTFVESSEDSPASIAYRERLNASGSPSEAIAAGYKWAPGTELAARADGKTTAART